MKVDCVFTNLTSLIVTPSRQTTQSRRYQASGHAVFWVDLRPDGVSQIISRSPDRH